MTDARSIALSALEQAKAAAKLETLHSEAIMMNAAHDKRVMHEAEFAAALPTLNKWFPGVEWKWSEGGDFSGWDTIVTDASEKWPPSFKLRVSARRIETMPVRYELDSIYVGDYRNDSEGYAYFSGNRVKSAADIGRYLEARNA